MPRIRQRLVVSRKDGSARLRTEVINDDAGFGQRMEGLKDSVLTEDIGAVESRSLALLCDGCGARAELDFDQPVKPDGWTEREDGDFCPACS